MRSSTMPGWVKVLLAVVALVVLGPPALAMLFVALGLIIKVGVVALKAAVVVGLVVLVLAGIRSLFGSSSPAPRRRLAEPSIDELAAQLEAEETQRRAALDLELARSLGRAR